MSKVITLTLTEDEAKNLQKFHNLRQSDSCAEALIGYDVEQKLAEALAAVAVG